MIWLSPFFQISSLPALELYLLWVILEKWVSLAPAHTAGEAGYSLAPLPLLLWEGSRASSFSKLSCLAERGEARNFLLQMCPNSFVLLVQGSTGISSLETQPSTKAHSSVGVCPLQCFPGVPGLQPRGVRIISQVPVSPETTCGSAYYMIHRWGRLLLGPLDNCAQSHSSHRGTFGHG